MKIKTEIWNKPEMEMKKSINDTIWMFKFMFLVISITSFMRYVIWYGTMGDIFMGVFAFLWFLMGQIVNTSYKNYKDEMLKKGVLVK